MFRLSVYPDIINAIKGAFIRLQARINKRIDRCFN